MKDPSIVFGPYLMRHSESQAVDRCVQNTGCSVEFVTPKETIGLPIFHCTEYVGEKPDFASYVIRQADLPFEIMTWGFQVKQHGGGPYITLSAYLAGVYARFDRLRPVQDFLMDFRELLPVENLRACAARAEFPLKSCAASAGYRIAYVMSYGRRLTADIVWLFPQARRTEESNSYLDVTSIDFRPKPDRTLGSGKWAEHRGYFVEDLLFESLRNIAQNAPLSLLEEVAKSRMLAEFDWSPLALMTSQQARQARIEFVQKHPQLIGDLKAMAAALKQAGLYSPNSTSHQICKFLPGLISQATRTNT